MARTSCTASTRQNPGIDMSIGMRVHLCMDVCFDTSMAFVGIKFDARLTASAEEPAVPHMVVLCVQ